MKSPIASERRHARSAINTIQADRRSAVLIAPLARLMPLAWRPAEILTVYNNH